MTADELLNEAAQIMERELMTKGFTSRRAENWLRNLKTFRIWELIDKTNRRASEHTQHASNLQGTI